MNDTFNLELTMEELFILSAAVGLYHKDCAKALYETLEGTRAEKDCVNVEEFDTQHKMLMNLYDKLGNLVKQIKT